MSLLGAALAVGCLVLLGDPLGGASTQLRGTLGWVAGAAGAATATLLATYYGSLAAGSITPRETEVLLELAQGKSNAEIAAALYLGEGTVKTHIAARLRKLQVRDRVQAAVAAYELGLVQPGTNA